MKTTSSRMAAADVMAEKGRSASIWNRTRDALPMPSPSSPSPVLNWAIAVLPNAVNQMMPIVTGANRTTAKYSRTVRPFEMRAMNMPTKGDQEIHQAQ